MRRRPHAALAALAALVLLAAPAGAQTPQPDFNAPLLTPTPSGGDGSTTPTPAGGTHPARSGTGRGRPARSRQAASARPSQLPNTGAEPGELGALGLGVVLLGVGLRLRTAPLRWDR